MCVHVSWCAHFFSPLIRDWSKPLSSKRVDDGGSERPAGANRATDADSAPEARSSLAASLNKVFHEERGNGEEPWKQSLPRLPKDRRDTIDSG